MRVGGQTVSKITSLMYDPLSKLLAIVTLIIFLKINFLSAVVIIIIIVIVIVIQLLGIVTSLKVNLICKIAICGQRNFKTFIV